MRFYGKVVRCDNTECGLPVFRLKAGRTLSDDEIKDLLTEGHTKLLKGFILLLILFFTYFALPDIGIRLNVVAAAIIAMSIFESAMLAEIVRSGINAVPRGQMEAARSNGLTFYQAMRYIIMPQALKKMIPPIVSQFISLVKDTSLATIILLPEATYHAQIIYGQNINYMIPMFVALAVMYFVVNYALSLASRWLDRRLVQSN